MSGLRAPDPTGRVVLAADPDAGTRRDVRDLLHSVDLPVETFTTGGDLLARCAEIEPACLVLELRLPDMSGLQVLDRLTAPERCCPPAVILTGHGDIPSAVAAIKRGVLDFLEKPFRPQGLLEQVQHALTLGNQARARRRQRADLRRALSTLSPREREILRLLLRDHPNKQVALHLGLSYKTVSWHRQQILARLGVSTLLELVRHPAADLLSELA